MSLCPAGVLPRLGPLGCPPLSHLLSQAEKGTRHVSAKLGQEHYKIPDPSGRFRKSLAHLERERRGQAPWASGAPTWKARTLGSKWLPCGSWDVASQVWRWFDPVSETCSREKSCKAWSPLLHSLSDRRRSLQARLCPTSSL